jgi:hypothetical protein
LGGGFWDMGPVAWFFFTLVVWLIAVPSYPVAWLRLAAASKSRAGVRWGLPSAQPRG